MNDRPAPSTVTEAIAALRALGYVADFEVIDGSLCVEGGVAMCGLEQVIVDDLYRFEGPSDPGDEMVVFALRDPATGERGTLAAAFGPTADPELRTHLSGLADRFG